jgi:hypothetical protein
MRTFQIRSLSLPALAFMVFAAGSNPSLTAQVKSPDLLTASEVQQLVSRAEPADHARLRAHFAALADQDAAEAKRHNAMQQAYAGNTKLAHIASSMSAHCKRLADLSLESAATLRALAADHGKVAPGVASEAARVGGPGPATVATPAASEKEMIDLAAGGSSAAEHRRLEQYFSTLATRYDREAADHAAYAKSWRTTTKVANAPAIAAHCDRVAAQRRELSKEAGAAASMHKEHAATAK